MNTGLNKDCCGGCGETDGNKRCIGCLHPFTTASAPEVSKIVPGDDIWLSIHMAPHHLNYLTGGDRKAVLGYGRAVYQAARKEDKPNLQPITDEAFAYFHRDPSRNPEYQQVMPGAAGHPGVIAAFTKPPPPPAGKLAALISDLHQLADEIQLSHRTESIDEAIEMLSSYAQPKPVFVRESDLDLDDLNKVLIDYRDQIARLRARIAVLDPVFSDAEGYQL